jgi:hypothetical protein
MKHSFSMKMNTCVILLLVLKTSSLYGQEKIYECQTKNTHCLPGEQLTVTSSPLQPNATLSLVALAPVNGGSVQLQAVPAIDKASHKIIFALPADAADGTYAIKISQSTPAANAGQPAASSDVTGLSPALVTIRRPVITAVAPTSAFRSSDKSNSFTLIGSGFTDRPEVQLRFLARKTPPVCGSADATATCMILKVTDDHTVEVQFNNPDKLDDLYCGPLKFVLDVGPAETASATMTLLRAESDAPLHWALSGVAVLAVIIFGLLWAGKKAIQQKISDRAYFLSALFLDIQTNTYSLSKCQFYAWTAAALFGYLYLSISKSIVQCSQIFPDIPSGLPGILLASAGTAVLSTGITSAKGDKGAGNPGPSLSDFIASGGVVAPDRLQFVVWTIVGIFTFLGIVVMSDPRSINDLPPIPPGFLQLMGISSAGYLAGKLARKAGPSISNVTASGSISATTVSNTMTFQLTGSGLSRSAMFKIDDWQIFPDTIVDSNGNAALPDVVQADPSIKDPDYARILKFTVNKPMREWLGNKYNFTITNPDAQRAVWPFQVFRVDKATLDPSKTQLTLTGDCLDANLIVTYTDGPSKTDTVSCNTASTTPTTYVGNLPKTLKPAVGDTVTVTDNSGMTQTLTIS